jgi:hypothetical protein
MSSAVTEHSNCVVWSYGENNHIELTIDNRATENPDKPKISLLKMKFEHLHPVSQAIPQGLSFSELHLRMTTITKCKYAIKSVGISASKNELDTFISEEEAKQVQVAANIHKNICKAELGHMKLAALNQLYAEVELETHEQKKKLLQKQVSAFEQMLGLNEDSDTSSRGF